MSSKSAAKKAAVKTAPAPCAKEKWRAFISANGYLGCAFIIPLTIMFMIFIAMEVYPFGEGSVLVLDLNGQYVYFFEALRNAVYEGGSLVYSWFRSLGGEFTGIYAYYLASPLSYIVCLFPKSHLTEALLLITLLKCGLSGGTMAFYLKKTRPKLHELVVISFGTLYALSSYAVVYAHNMMWIDAVLLLPLILYGEEKLIKEGKFILFVSTLSLSILSNFYIGYMTCIFVFLYFFFAMVTKSEDGQTFGRGVGNFFKALGRMAIFSGIAVAISAIIILPTYYSLKFGKTTFSDPSWEVSSRFNLLDMLIKIYPGAYDTVRPEGLPWLYCGILPLLTLPCFFLSKNVRLREKAAAAVLMVVMVVSMNINVIDLVWHGMQQPNWLNYRYSFMLIFLVLVCAARAFEHPEDLKFPVIAASGVLLALLIIVIQKLGYKYVDDFSCVWYSLACIGVFVFSMHAVCGKYLKAMGLTLLAVLVSVETFISGIILTNALDADVVYSTRTSYNEYMDRLSPSVDYVKAHDDSLYRSEKFIYAKYQSDGKNCMNVYRKVCDNMALGLRGISGSTSTLNAAVVEYLNQLGYSSVSHWSSYIGGNPVSDALIGIKYVTLEDTDKYVSDVMEQFYADPANTLMTYENPYALSVAYAVDAAYRDNFAIREYYTPFEMMNAMVTAMLGDDEPVEIFKPLSSTMDPSGVKRTYDGPVYEIIHDENGKEVLDENGNLTYNEIQYEWFEPDGSGDGKILYTFTVPENGDTSDVYLFLCSNYPRRVNWDVVEDPENYGSFFDNESDCIQSLGKLEAGKTYTVAITIVADDNIVYLRKGQEPFYYLDKEAFADAFTRLKAGNLNITSFTDTKLSGTVDAADNQTVMFTSIPYDEGWHVYVDGKETEIYRSCKALLGFDITPGHHEIEMKYSCKWYNMGALISIAGVLAFAGAIVLDRFVFKKKKASADTAETPETK